MKVKKLERDLIVAGYASPMKLKIPFLVVGFEGYMKTGVLIEKMKLSNIDTALVINNNVFCNLECSDIPPKQEEFEASQDHVALWGFTKYLYTIIGSGAMFHYDIRDEF